ERQYRHDRPPSARLHHIPDRHLAPEWRQADAAVVQLEDRADGADVLVVEADGPALERGVVDPAEAPQLAVGVPAEVQPGDGLLAGVAALGVRDAPDVVEAHFLRQGPVADLGTERRPAG